MNIKKIIGWTMFVFIVGGGLTAVWIVNGFLSVIGTILGTAIGIGLGMLICKLTD